MVGYWKTEHALDLMQILEIMNLCWTKLVTVAEEQQWGQAITGSRSRGCARAALLSPADWQSHAGAHPRGREARPRTGRVA